jgi:hypothetical protein
LGLGLGLADGEIFDPIPPKKPPRRSGKFSFSHSLILTLSPEKARLSGKQAVKFSVRIRIRVKVRMNFMIRVKSV